MMKRTQHILYASLVSIMLYSCTEMNLLTFNTACIIGDINTSQGIILATLVNADSKKKDILFSKNSNNEYLLSGANTLTDPTNKQLYVGGRYTFQSQRKNYQNNVTLFSLFPVLPNVYIDYNAIDKDIGYAKALGNGLMGLISSDKQTVYIVSIYGDIIFTKTTNNEFTAFETTWSTDNKHGLLAIGGNNIDNNDNDGMLIPLRQSTNNRCKYTAESFKVFQTIKPSKDSTIVDIVLPNYTNVNIIDKQISKNLINDNAWPLFLLVDYGKSEGIAIEHIAIKSTTPFSSLAKAVVKSYTLENQTTLRAAQSTDPRPFLGDSMVFISNNNYIALLVLMQGSNNTIHAMSFVQEKLKSIDLFKNPKDKDKDFPPSEQKIEGHTFKSFSPYMRVHNTRLAIGAIENTPPTRFFALLSFSVSAPTEVPTSNSTFLKSELIRFEKKLIPKDTDADIKDFIYK